MPNPCPTALMGLVQKPSSGPMFYSLTYSRVSPHCSAFFHRPFSNANWFWKTSRDSFITCHRFSTLVSLVPHGGSNARSRSFPISISLRLLTTLGVVFGSHTKSELDDHVITVNQGRIKVHLLYISYFIITRSNGDGADPALYLMFFIYWRMEFSCS